MKSNQHAGQFNLKGKKCKNLSCGCCIVENFKDKEEIKRIKKEILESYHEKEAISKSEFS